MNTKLLRALSLTTLGLTLVACGGNPAPTKVVADTSKNAESLSKKELGDGANKNWST